MKILFVIASYRFMDREYTIPRDALLEKGFECVTASTIKGTCYGMHGEIIESDLALDDVNADDYDGIIIAGGIGCQDELWRNEKLVDIVNKIGVKGKLTAAICLAPVIIGEAGLLAGKKATTFDTPACHRVLELDKATVVSDNVVRDGNVVTAKGPFDAEEFTKEILKVLS